MHDETSIGALAVARVACPAGVGVGRQVVYRVLERVVEDESRFADEVAAKSFELCPVPVRRFTHCAATFFGCELQIITIRRQEIRSGAYRLILLEALVV